METELQEDFPWLDNASRDAMMRAVQAMYRVHKFIGAITDLDTLLEYITEESQQVAGAEASSIILYDTARNDLYFHIALGESGDPETLKRQIRLQLGEGIAGAAAASRTSINVENAQEDVRFSRSADDATNFQTRSLLAVPMLDRDQLVGVLELVNKIDSPSFSLLDMRVMEMFSSLAATSISNARLVQEKIETGRMAAIGQAVTGLSHYTKNIVTGLNSSADLIEAGLAQDNLEVLRKTWPVFKRSTKRITHFVQDMLSYSKPRTPFREWVALDPLLDEVVESYAELFFRKDIRVTLEGNGQGVQVYVEPQSIHRCLLNLVTNAADAVPAEGGQIVIAVAEPAPGTLTITVSDNGPGVQEDVLPRIFDPFFSTKGAKGTGLGLAITRKIVEEHEGSLTVQRSDLGGAAFVISLPHDPARERSNGLL